MTIYTKIPACKFCQQHADLFTNFIKQKVTSLLSRESKERQTLMIVHSAGHSDKAALVPYSRGCPLKIVWDTDMKQLKIRTEEHQKIKKEEKKATLVHVNRLSVDHRTIVSTGRYSEWTCKISQCFLEHCPSIFSFAKFFSLGIKCYTRWFCTGF